MGDVEAHFLDLGVQYYVAARAAMLAGLVPVCGNIYHHAIEALLKSRLSQKYSRDTLSKKPFGHNLPTLWSEFKNEFPGAAFAQHDRTVTNLDKFERLRYPDDVLQHGAEIVIGGFVGSSSAGRPRYELDPPEIDALVADIFQICSKNPTFFTGKLNAYGKDALTRGNVHGNVLLKQP
jgi:hypothetical protein